FAYEEVYRSDAPSSLPEMLYRGFYPRIHDQNLNPTEALSFYTSTYLERDLQSFLQVRDLGTFERFLRLCAAHTGQLVNHNKLGSDCGIDQKTAQAWLSILEASYIVYSLPPYSRNFRKRIVKSHKLYFYDVGLAAYLLNISSPLHLENHPLKGALFENFVITEFLKNRFNHVQGNNLFFFRDHVGHEVDLVLDYGSEIQSVEIKAGQTMASDYFKGLEFFGKLAKTKNQASYFVYAGTESRIQKGIRIFSYQTLPKLFEEITYPARQG
ncbi:MAG: DUF4143 domain-containing protein, partial [Deltaproteobacteria bacterium]|nr:DUF4143 domain-containing protein [Deltaproteobacteria bacterium]